MDSIFSQTYGDYEIILLDDASTDESAEMLKEYAKNPKVSSLTINGQNTGKPFLQWKRGIEKAKGEYIWIAEADDKAEPLFLQRCVEALDNNPNAVLAFTGSKTIDENGNPGKIDYDAWPARHQKRALHKATFVFNGSRYATHNQIWCNRVYNASGTVFRKAAFDGDPDFDACYPMRNVGDHLFWTILMKKGDVIEIYEKLNRFRRHSISQSAQGIQHGAIQPYVYYEQIDVMNYIFNTFKPGAYRKAIVRGDFSKRIHRSNLPKEEKRELFRQAELRGNISKGDYILGRIHKFFWNIIPGMIDVGNDRL